MSAANGEDLIVVRVGRDRHGDPRVASEHVLRGCIVAPSTSTENVAEGDQVVSRYDVYVMAGADVRSTDRIRRPTDPAPAKNAAVRVRGPWRVIGDPEPWRSPFGSWTPGSVVQIERVTG